MDSALRSRLREVLEESRALGFLGPGEIDPQLAHAEAFAELLEGALEGEPAEVLDLGAGGGLPGLVLACRWCGARVVLLDAARRRCEALRRFVGSLELGERVTVLEGRGEDLARDERWRERFELVVARSFGAPAVTAEIGSGFLRVGGLLAVSEPPEQAGTGDVAGRWPAEPLTSLGLALRGVRRDPGGRASTALLAKEQPVDARFPRRSGIPAKRRLW